MDRVGVEPTTSIHEQVSIATSGTTPYSQELLLKENSLLKSHPVHFEML
jgi:hypothetical protein